MADATVTAAVPTDDAVEQRLGDPVDPGLVLLEHEDPPPLASPIQLAVVVSCCRGDSALLKSTSARNCS